MAAPTIHLEIDGIEGDSVATNFEGQIDCSSWNWGASQAANTHSATGGAAGGSSVQDIAVTKSMDSATPNLMKYCCLGKHFPTMKLSCTKSGEGQIVWLEIEMKNVIISSVQFGGQEGSQGSESMTLNFEEYKMMYYPQASEGSQGASIDAAYNIYRARHWKEARSTFENLKERTDQLLYNVYLQRIESFEADPPAEIWDGVFEHKTK
jgi:type VI secretion system secreted protein Hcp